MKKHFDLNLYLVTDAPEKCRFGMLETVERAVAGGVTIVQYRSTNPDAGTCWAEAKPLADFLRSRGITFIVNNRVDLALALDADGVHVGQRDLPVPQTRRLIGPEKFSGSRFQTAHSSTRSIPRSSIISASVRFSRRFQKATRHRKRASKILQNSRRFRRCRSSRSAG